MPPSVPKIRILECQAINHIIRDSQFTFINKFVEMDNIETFIHQIQEGIKRFSNLAFKNITDQKPSYRHAKYKIGRDKMILLLLGNNDKCTLAFVNEFARIYSLTTHKYKNLPNDTEFKRYSALLRNRNGMIKGSPNTTVTITW
jgi:hypothetical protein